MCVDGSVYLKEGHWIIEKAWKLEQLYKREDNLNIYIMWSFHDKQ